MKNSLKTFSSGKHLTGIISVFLALASLVSKAQVVPRHHKMNTLGAQQKKSKSKLVIQMEVENGGMLYNNKQVKEDFGDIYYNGLNLKVGWQTENGTDVYHQLHNYPIYGIGVYSSTFDKPEIGAPNALYGFVAIPIKPGKFRRWDFNYRISLGLASNFEPYDEENNPLNNLLGSHRNVFIDLGLQANYRLGNHFQLGGGFAFHHFSNGAIRKPNKGINLLPLTIALTYRPRSGAFDLDQALETLPAKTDQYHVQYAGGIKQLDQGRKRHFKSTLGLFWSRPLGYKWRMGLGADIFYSHSGMYAETAGDQASAFGALFSGGPALYTDYVLTSKLYINSNIGWYVHRNQFNGESAPIYLRIGTRYKVIGNSYAGVSIKAHKGTADFVEWTIGHTITRKSKK